MEERSTNHRGDVDQEPCRHHIRQPDINNPTPVRKPHLNTPLHAPLNLRILLRCGKRAYVGRIKELN
jgi:hypothetical protein